MLAEIDLLRKQLVGTRELEKAKNQLEAGFTFAQDSIFSQAMLIATYEIVSSWRDADKYVPAIRAVSATDVKRVAQKYLVPENCVTARLVPIPSAEQKPVRPGSPKEEQIVR